MGYLPCTKSGTTGRPCGLRLVPRNAPVRVDDLGQAQDPWAALHAPGFVQGSDPAAQLRPNGLAPAVAASLDTVGSDRLCFP